MQKGYSVVLVLLIIGLVIGVYLLGKSLQLGNKIKVVSTPIPVVTEAPAEKFSFGDVKKIDLYSLQITLPQDWNIQEFNRRPEPEGAGKVLGHDCAEYDVYSKDNLAHLYLKPVCGFADGGPQSLPSNYDQVGIIGNDFDKIIIRYIDKQSAIYKYGLGNRTTKTFGPLSITKNGIGDNGLIVFIELKNTATYSYMQTYFQAADRIVNSLKKIE